MFLFKKVVSQFLFPMPVCLFLCFTGLALLWWTKRQRTGKIFLTVGILVMTTLSYGFVADALLRPLEREYPPYTTGNGRFAGYVVVLGGGHNSDPTLPVTSQIGDESLKRLIEGIRIYRENPGSKLLLSGGSWLDPVSNAEVMSKTARILGMSESDIVLECESKDTASEARLLKPILGTNDFILVTSAAHMPRSISLFARESMKPTPAPAEHMVREHFVEPSSFFPSGGNLRRTERAFYEILGASITKLTSGSGEVNGSMLLNKRNNHELSDANSR